MALQHVKWNWLWQFLTAESCELLTQELRLTCCRGSRSFPVIDRIVSCISPTVLTVQHKVVSNIFFNNRLRQSLTKFNFLTKIIKALNIFCFWRISRNIYQNADWPLNIFVIISWRKVKLLTRFYLGVSYLCWAQVQTMLLRLTTSFLQFYSRWNRVVFPMLQMFLFQCFKWKFTSSELFEKNWRLDRESKLLRNKPHLFV